MDKEKLLETIKDPKSYLEAFCKIKSKSDGLIPFKLNEAQKDIFNVMRRENRVIILKARQIGFSSAITAFMYHKTITNPGTTTVLIGYNSDLASEFLDKVKTYYRSTPDALRPKVQYNSKFEVSFPAIDSKIIVLPSSDQVGRGYTINNCLGKETLLFKEDGCPVKICEVKHGDRIVNGNGGISTVINVSSKKPTNRVFDISVWHGDILTATEDHKVLCRGSKQNSFKPEWRMASEITKGDYIAFPYRQIRDRVKSLKLLTIEECGLKRVTKATFMPTTLVIPVDRDLGELFGWYMAEGSSFDSGIVFSVDKDEVEHLVALIRKVLNGIYSSIRIDKVPDSRATNIVVNGRVLAEFIRKYIPGRAWEKTIPNSMWYWGPRFNEGLIWGLFSGDGCFTSLDKINLTTVSPRLAHQVRLMLVSLRIGLASVHRTETSRYGKKTRDRYCVDLTGKENWKFRHKFGLEKHRPRNGRERFKSLLSENIAMGRSYSRRGKTHYWMRVKCKKITMTDIVYDISIDSSPHSFLTGSGVVHNCLASELAFWDKPEEKMLALESAVPRNGLLVCESTPAGIGNLYHRMWMAENNGYVKKEYGWWWLYSEEEIEEIKKRINDPMRFAQEYQLEFLSTGRPVFNAQMVKRLMQKNVLKVGDVVKNEDGTTHFVTEREDGLRMYYPPRPGATYVAGADVAEGVTGGDYSTCTIFDRETGEEVAMYRGHMAPDKFGGVLNTWGRMYNNALMVVEINNHGISTITTLRNLMYPQLYFRPAKFDTMGTSWTERLGWKTTKSTRPLMIDDLNEVLREGSLILHSEEVYNEMFTFIFDDNSNMITPSGFKDDLIFSCAIGYQGFKVMFKGTLDQLGEEHYSHIGYNY